MHEFTPGSGYPNRMRKVILGKVAELQELVADSRWHDAVFEVRNLNGGHFFSATGFVNRPREEGDRLDLFLAIITRRLPGSYGLIYDRSDERPYPPGPSSFRVRVLARGKLTEHPDPFLQELLGSRTQRLAGWRTLFSRSPTCLVLRLNPVSCTSRWISFSRPVTRSTKPVGLFLFAFRLAFLVPTYFFGERCRRQVKGGEPHHTARLPAGVFGVR